MADDGQQRGASTAGQPSRLDGNGVRRRQHQQQRQQQQEQRDPYRRIDRELPEKQHQTRHPRVEDPRFQLPTGDQ